MYAKMTGNDPAQSLDLSYKVVDLACQAVCQRSCNQQTPLTPGRTLRSITPSRDHFRDDNTHSKISARRVFDTSFDGHRTAVNRSSITRSDLIRVADRDRDRTRHIHMYCLEKLTNIQIFRAIFNLGLFYNE